jgi:hypothetical protein
MPKTEQEAHAEAVERAKDIEASQGGHYSRDQFVPKPATGPKDTRTQK